MGNTEMVEADDSEGERLVNVATCFECPNAWCQSGILRVPDVAAAAVLDQDYSIAHARTLVGFDCQARAGIARRLLKAPMAASPDVITTPCCLRQGRLFSFCSNFCAALWTPVLKPLTSRRYASLCPLLSRMPRTGASSAMVS